MPLPYSFVWFYEASANVLKPVVLDDFTPAPDAVETVVRDLARA
jgi:hypothetical protein